MADDVVAKAVGNDLILEKIFKLSEFSSLKQHRLVSKTWNEVACRVLRKLCEDVVLSKVDDYQKYQELYSSLPNQDLLAKLSIDATILVHDLQNHLQSFLLTTFANATWTAQLYRLTLSSELTAEDGNRLTPFLLKQVPTLKELHLNLNGDKRLLVGFPVTKLASDAKFDLEILKYHLIRSEKVVDPTFLCHCPKLHTITLSHVVGDDSTFPRLCQLWKRVALENVDFPRCPNLKFKLRKYSGFGSRSPSKQVNDWNQLQALAEFINVNEPSSLKFLGPFDYNFLSLFGNIGQWDSDVIIKSLTTHIPMGSPEGQRLRADLLLRLLRQFAVFAHLTEVCLVLPERDEYGRQMALDELEIKGPSVHHLSNLTSLELHIPRLAHNREYDVTVVQQAAGQLPKLTRLKLHAVLNEVVLENVRRPCKHKFDSVFGACSQFSALRELVIDLGDDQSSALGWRKHQIVVYKLPGFFHALSQITNLKTITVDVISSASKDGLLVSLFHGYEPHCNLNLHVPCRIRIGDHKRHLVQMSVDGFKKALRDAQHRELKVFR